MSLLTHTGTHTCPRQHHAQYFTYVTVLFHTLQEVGAVIITMLQMMKLRNREVK